jgi:NADPH2:quinone reductase
VPAAIRLTRTGGPEALTFEEIDQVVPGPGQVWIEHEAIGVNYLDVMQRNGAVPLKLPSGLGYEGAGRIAAIGAGVDAWRVGDRVAYAAGEIGAYASGRLYAADRLVQVPDSLSASDVAAVLFKGIATQYLIKTTFPVGPGKVIVIYGAGGAVGQIMVPWSKKLGATVIGVVTDESSVARALTSGCDTVLVWGKDDVPSEVARLTDGKKADAVFDPIGKNTFEASLDSLRPRGVMVSFGASSGEPPATKMQTLNVKGSLFITRPSLAAHTTDSAEYRGRVKDVLDAVTMGIIQPSIWKSYPLLKVAEAHAALEEGKSRGAIVLIP